MAKSSKATRGSTTSARSKKPSAAAAKKKPAARAKPPARSAKPAKKANVAAAAKRAPAKRAAVKAKPAAKAAATSAKPVKVVAVKAPAVKTVAPLKLAAPLATSALLRGLRVEEQHAVKLALSGKATLLQSSPRARDAVLFAAAASLAKHPVLVAAPLAAELFAQASAMVGIEVVAFGSFVAPAVATAGKKRLQRGGPLLVVIEPAQLFDSSLRETFAKAPLGLLGIAAAHACSEHAHELSPAYLSLREALRAFTAPVLATCTSTSHRVVEQVTEAIGASAESVVQSAEQELSRAAQVVRATERKSALFAAILSYGAPGIVLTATPQEADSVYAELCARKVPCLRAHAGMAPSERADALAKFTLPGERLVLVTQSPHANASGLAGCPEASQVLGSAPPRSDLAFVLHYQAPLSPEQQFEDLAWLPTGGNSLVLADSSDAALVQALLAQQRIKPAAIEAMAQVLAQAPDDRPAFCDTLALRAGTSRRSAERVLSAFADRSLIVKDSGQISRKVGPDQLFAEGRLLSARFAALRAADSARAETVARYVTSRHGTAPTLAQDAPQLPRHVRA